MSRVERGPLTPPSDHNIPEEGRKIFKLKKTKGTRSTPQSTSHKKPGETATPRIYKAAQEALPKSEPAAAADSSLRRKSISHQPEHESLELFPLSLKPAELESLEGFGALQELQPLPDYMIQEAEPLPAYEESISGSEVSSNYSESSRASSPSSPSSVSSIESPPLSPREPPVEFLSGALKAYKDLEQLSNAQFRETQQEELARLKQTNQIGPHGVGVELERLREEETTKRFEEVDRHLDGYLAQIAMELPEANQAACQKAIDNCFDLARIYESQKTPNTEKIQAIYDTLNKFVTQFALKIHAGEFSFEDQMSAYNGVKSADFREEIDYAQEKETRFQLVDHYSKAFLVKIDKEFSHADHAQCQKAIDTCLALAKIYEGRKSPDTKKIELIYVHLNKYVAKLAQEINAGQGPDRDTLFEFVKSLRGVKLDSLSKECREELVKLEKNLSDTLEKVFSGREFDQYQEAFNALKDLRTALTPPVAKPQTLSAQEPSKPDTTIGRRSSREPKTQDKAYQLLSEINDNIEKNRDFEISSMSLSLVEKFLAKPENKNPTLRAEADKVKKRLDAAHHLDKARAHAAQKEYIQSCVENMSAGSYVDSLLFARSWNAMGAEANEKSLIELNKLLNSNPREKRTFEEICKAISLKRIQAFLIRLKGTNTKLHPNEQAKEITDIINAVALEVGSDRALQFIQPVLFPHPSFFTLTVETATFTEMARTYPLAIAKFINTFVTQKLREKEQERGKLLNSYVEQLCAILSEIPSGVPGYSPQDNSLIKDIAKSIGLLPSVIDKIQTKDELINALREMNQQRFSKK